MRRGLLSLAAAVLALSAPVIADARPDNRGGGGGRDRPRAERQRDEAPRQRGRERPRDFRAQPPIYNSLGEGWREQQDEARRGVRQGGYRPLAQVLGDLQRRNPGRQLDAGIERWANGRPVYRVRWAGRNGRRIDYIVDARTGAILRAEGQ